MTVVPLPEGLSTQQVALRPFREDDAVAVLQACRNPLIRRFTVFIRSQPPRRRERGDRGRRAVLDLR